MDLEGRAKEFATRKHGGQVRKYTGEPYINHPAAVVEIVRSVPHTEEIELREGCLVIKVPGGWIYRFSGHAVSYAVFVPYRI